MPVLKDKSKRNELRKNLYEALESQGQPIATTVKSLRKILAMSQADFSRYVGISLSALRRVEQDNGNIEIATLNKILTKFRLELVVRVRG